MPLLSRPPLSCYTGPRAWRPPNPGPVTMLAHGRVPRRHPAQGSRPTAAGLLSSWHSLVFVYRPTHWPSTRPRRKRSAPSPKRRKNRSSKKSSRATLRSSSLRKSAFLSRVLALLCGIDLSLVLLWVMTDKFVPSPYPQGDRGQGGCPTSRDIERTRTERQPGKAASCHPDQLKEGDSCHSLILFSAHHHVRPILFLALLAIPPSHCLFILAMERLLYLDSHGQLADRQNQTCKGKRNHREGMAKRKQMSGGPAATSGGVAARRTGQVRTPP